MKTKFFKKVKKLAVGNKALTPVRESGASGLSEHVQTEQDHGSEC